MSPEAAQAADIIGVRQEAEFIMNSRRAGSASSADRHRLNIYRALLLRRIMQAVLQIQYSESRLEAEMAYTYDVLARLRRKQETVDQIFNLINFAQVSAIYGFLEPRSRIHKQFTQSAVGTCVGAGLGIGLPVFNILYDKFLGSSAKHVAPPEFMSHAINGAPVDGSHLSPLLSRYLDSTAHGNTRSRRDLMSELWKKRYHADLSKPETLCGLNDNKAKSNGLLNTRIVLLWSLYTTVQAFNKDLLALLNQVADYQTPGEHPGSARIDPQALPAAADEVTRLLGLETLVEQMKSADFSGDDERKLEVQLALLERLLSGYLDMQIAVDRCQEELNYQYDVVLAQMTARRGKFLQKTYEVNFIQTGTLGACAGWSYLNHYGKAGNQLFMVENALGIAITTVSLLATHGGWRKNESDPNSLADFFNLRSGGVHGFSPLVWNYLDSPQPNSKNGKSRRQALQELWMSKAVSSMDLKKKNNLEKLGSMPSCKWDTIKLVTNRIRLLLSLQEQLLQFDEEILALLRKTWPSSLATTSVKGQILLNPQAQQAADIIGVNPLLSDIAGNRNDESAKLLLTRHIFENFLDANTNANILSHQIVTESQVMNHMVSQRDLAIQLTNIANFYQIGILGIISDALGVCENKYYVLVGDRINLISGGLIGGLALSAFLERHGGFRMFSKPETNAISSAFGRQSGYLKLSPVMLKYMNAVSPDSKSNLSRRDELVKYWKESKILSVNVKRDSTVEKLSAESKARHWWSETIKMISNRITMLYDLRALLRTSINGFDELLDSVDRN